MPVEARRTLILITLLVILAAACSGAAPVDTPSAGQGIDVTAVGSDEPQPLATIRTELAATDPAGVSLASGRVQLVEFFAFW